MKHPKITQNDNVMRDLCWISCFCCFLGDFHEKCTFHEKRMLFITNFMSFRAITKYMSFDIRKTKQRHLIARIQEPDYIILMTCIGVFFNLPNFLGPPSKIEFQKNVNGRTSPNSLKMHLFFRPLDWCWHMQHHVIWVKCD